MFPLPHARTPSLPEPSEQHRLGVERADGNQSIHRGPTPGRGLLRRGERIVLDTEGGEPTGPGCLAPDTPRAPQRIGSGFAPR